MLSKTTKEELRREEKALKKEYAELQVRIAAVGSTLSHISALLGSTGGGRSESVPKSNESPMADLLSGKGTRAAILTTLSMFPAGLRPTEIATHMESMGYRNKAPKTATRTLVSGDLNRLLAAGRVQRNKKKRYTLASPEAAPKENVSTVS